jgi:hypothetical protein
MMNPKQFREMIILFLIGSMFSVSFADEQPTLETLKQTKSMADHAMADFALGKIKSGYHRLRPYWHIPDSEIDTAAERTEATIDLAISRYGKVIGHEFIKEDKVKDFLVQYTYVLKFERHVLRWMFIFYMPKQTWMFSSVVSDDRANLLFE